MSLLREIQNAAIDANTSLATLLRKCKVLAARLGNNEFKNWVESELNGYRDTNELPEYRVIKVNSKGHFSGPFGSGLKNADIPLFCIDEKFHKKLSYSYFTQPVAALESLVEDSNSGTLSEPWNPDLVAYLGEKFYENMNCMQAWKIIPVATVVAALDAVRNRVLNFVLEIEAEYPDAGEAQANSNPVPQEKVNQIFNTYITGDVQNLAAGNHHANQTATRSSENEKLFEELLSTLHKSQENRAIIEKLTSSVEEMRSNQGSKAFKDHYKNFISTLSDHMQVFGPVVAPFLPALAAMVP
ncbi:AbiTii domain-containing protein [Pseudomonas nicosulfuronedens]